MQKYLDENIHSRLKQAVTSLDVTFSHAELAANRAKNYLGDKCSEDVLTGIRTIVATIPDVRTVSMVKHNQIYCTSVFGGKKFNINQGDYPDSSLTLLGGNQITPSNALMIYSLQDSVGNSALIGVDGYYLYNVLRVLDSNSHLYLKIGNNYLNRSGHVTSIPEMGMPVQLDSAKFKYTVIADRSGQAGLNTFFHYESNLFFAILIVSLLLTFLFESYLSYRGTLEYMLREAIQKKILKPYIQPIVEGNSGRIIGGEVLVRWEHPKLGFIPPDNFIAVAEQTGLIKGVTEICFTKVLKQFCEYEQTLPEGLFICFNISAVNFLDDEIIGLCERFQYQLEKSKTRVVLEITERESIENCLRTNSITEKLRQVGVQFSLDDFGTGHANYTYLQQFHPEYIKVDKIFTSSVATNAASVLVVKNMVNLAQKFNCHIIAEGIENNSQLHKLNELGIDIFQGYYFSPPIPVNDYLKALKPSQVEGK
jgi:EAL domain-containing protein (putative c-di-GMP-specific phosphodiesterase class I)